MPSSPPSRIDDRDPLKDRKLKAGPSESTVGNVRPDADIASPNSSGSILGEIDRQLSDLLRASKKMDTIAPDGGPDQKGVDNEKNKAVRELNAQVASLDTTVRRVLAKAEAAQDLPYENQVRILPASWKSDYDPGYLVFMKRVAQLAIQNGEDPRTLYSPNYATRILSLLPIKKDSTIADVGAGTGAFEVALAKSGMPFEKVYAVDINSTGLEIMNFVLSKAGSPTRKRVEAVVSTLEDVTLPADSVDVALIVNTPFVIARGQIKAELIGQNDAQEMRCLRTLTKAMRPGAELHEFALWETHTDGISPQVRTQLEALYAQAGLKLLRLDLVGLAGEDMAQPSPNAGLHLHAVCAKSAMGPTP
ncbi:MAG: class I SAM-dependent methyltransferase [Deltaproteobacteria bacterium]|nr:class I SAM-dependent methyltransferase [Deltaproteobacteria bacterium]